jgi:hypothetical protein
MQVMPFPSPAACREYVYAINLTILYNYFRDSWYLFEQITIWHIPLLPVLSFLSFLRLKSPPQQFDFTPCGATADLCAASSGQVVDDRSLYWLRRSLIPLLSG